MLRAPTFKPVFQKISFADCEKFFKKAESSTVLFAANFAAKNFALFAFNQAKANLFCSN